MAKVFLNSKIIDGKNAAISVFDRGLQYGDGAFETILCKNGKPLFLDEHLKRLNKGLRSISITPPSENFIRLGIKRLLSANKLGNKTSRIKIIVTRGIDYGSYLPSRSIEPTVIITTSDVDEKALQSMRENGINAVFVPFTPHPLLGAIKSLNYLPSVTAKMRAAAAKSHEAVFTTPKGLVLEGSSSNIFIVKNKTLITPALKTKEHSAHYSILNGVTRTEILKIAKNLGLRIKERIVRKSDVLSSDEAFVTNSIALVLPLVRIDGRRISNGKPGESTRRLLLAIDGAL